MKITFIYPAIGNKEGRTFTPFSKMEPLMFAVLAGKTPEDIEVKFHDDRLEPIPYDESTDLVAITVETYTAKRSYEIAFNYRKRGVTVIMGGCHPTLIPEEVLEHADSVIVGEAEGLWSNILDDAKRKRLKRVYKMERPARLTGIKPKTNIFDNKLYLPVSLVYFGRGCKYSCEFCAVNACCKQRVNHRPVQDVIAEIESRKNRIIFFVDDNIAIDINKAKALFKGLIPLKIHWVGKISINFANDDELLRLMSRSGCVGVLIGFESLNMKNLTQIKKECNTEVNSYTENIRRIKHHGIMIWGSFLLGCDADNIDSFSYAVDFAIRNKFVLAAFNQMMPYPGTSFYKKLKSEGRLLYDNWWLAPTYSFGHAVFKPKQMTPEQLTEGCFKARLEFNKYSSILRRALDIEANIKNIHNMLAYFFYNFVARKEVNFKQNMKLGLEV